MRYFFILFILFSTKVFSGIPFPEANSKFSGKVFIISIGVDQYGDRFPKNKYCQSDADYFLKSLERDTSIKEIIKYTLRDDSTKDQLLTAFKDITTRAGQQDLIIFYYAGLSHGKSFFLRYEELKYEEVFIFSQRVFSKRQIYISDAYAGKQFGIAFQQFLEDKPLEKLFTKMDRIIISSKDVARELRPGANLKDTLFAGGQLTGGICNSKFSVMSLFPASGHSDRFWTEFKNEIYTAYESKTYFPDLFVFSERDYLKQIEKELYRGIFEGKNKESNDKSTTIKKGETLSIIVGNQNFTYLGRLSNVMNDVSKFSRILNENYKTNTILLKDISYKSFCDTLIQIKKTYTFEEGSQILFYSASHGLKDNFGLGYLCFADTKTDDNMATSFELQNLKRVITSFGATNTLMIMDICHSGLAFEETNCTTPTMEEIPLNNPIFTTPFGPYSPAFKNFLNEKTNLYFGSSRDQEAADGSGQNSPFASVIISFLESNQLPVIDSYHLQKSIESRVMKEGAISFPTFCSYNCAPKGRFLFIRE